MQNVTEIQYLFDEYRLNNKSIHIHLGLDNMTTEQIMSIDLGRLDTYTDELYKDFVQFIKTNGEEYKCGIYEKIYNLNRREKLIIARTYRKVFMNEFHHVNLYSQPMYCCNKQSDRLFSRLIDMLDTNYNKLDEMSDIISDIVQQERNIITKGLMSVIYRGKLK